MNNFTDNFMTLRTPEEFLDGVLELVKGITGEIRRIQRPEE